jgi:hypothetical protein
VAASGRSSDYAQECDDSQLTAYVLMRKSNIATDADQPARALGLAAAALRRSAGLGPQLHAVVRRQEALAHALAGDRNGTARALDAARAEVAEVCGPDRQTDLAGYCTPSYVEMEAGACWTRLRQPAKAVRIYEAGLRAWPPESERDRGLFLARLAVAHAAGGDPERACLVAHEAIAVSRKTGSARIAVELRALRDGLSPWRRLPAVAEVKAALAGLTS